DEEVRTVGHGREDNRAGCGGCKELLLRRTRVEPQLRIGRSGEPCLLLRQLPQPLAPPRRTRRLRKVQILPEVTGLRPRELPVESADLGRQPRCEQREPLA